MFHGSVMEVKNYKNWGSQVSFPLNDMSSYQAVFEEHLFNDVSNGYCRAQKGGQLA